MKINSITPNPINKQRSSKDVSVNNKLGFLESFLYTSLKCLKRLPKHISLPTLSFFWHFPGFIGNVARYSFIYISARNCGKRVYIDKAAIFKNVKNLSIGNNVSFHAFCYVDAWGGIRIGDNVSFAHSVSLVSFNHSYSTPLVPIKYSESIPGPISIRDDVWVGCGVRILANSCIESRSIVAAGAVVNKSYPPCSLIGGVPARVIKSIAR
jgi:acetyltransferase-like isoleucine patch superfamily enzyme